eukprot:365390-Chlamydomonas_euryale.AAC.14
MLFTAGVGYGVSCGDVAWGCCTWHGMPQSQESPRADPTSISALETESRSGATTGLTPLHLSQTSCPTVPDSFLRVAPPVSCELAASCWSPRHAEDLAAPHAPHTICKARGAGAPRGKSEELEEAVGEGAFLGGLICPSSLALVPCRSAPAPLSLPEEWSTRRQRAGPQRPSTPRWQITYAKLAVCRRLLPDRFSARKNHTATPARTPLSGVQCFPAAQQAPNPTARGSTCRLDSSEWLLQSLINLSWGPRL